MTLPRNAAAPPMGSVNRQIEYRSRARGIARGARYDIRPADAWRELTDLPVQLGGGFGRRHFSHSRTRQGLSSLTYAVWAGRRVERIAPRRSRFANFQLAQHVTRQSSNGVFL